MATLKSGVVLPSKAPNLPVAPVEYSQQYIEQVLNALRLYFAQVDNATANSSSNSIQTTGTAAQLLANNGTGGFANVNVGSGLTYSGGTLTATTGSSGTVSRNGTPFTGAISRPYTDMFGDYLSGLDFGMVGDGSTDNVSALNAAIAAAVSLGKSLYIPAGAYIINSTISISGGITIFGDYPSPTYDANINPTKGTWLYLNHNGIGFNCNTTQAEIVFRSFGTFRSTQVKPVGGTGSYTPITQDPDFNVSGNGDAQFYNMFILNPYIGIKSSPSLTALGAVVIVKNLKCQPISRGIWLDYVQDTSYISDIHIWPFWDVLNANSTGYTNLWVYTMHNMYGFALYRCDNVMMTDVFTIFANAGICLGSSTYGVPNKIHVANADFDRGYYGILVDGSNSTQGTTGQFVNVSMQGEDPSVTPYSQGILLTNAKQVILNFSNLRITYYQNYGIYIDDGCSNCDLTLSNLVIDGYGVSVSGSNAVSIHGSGNTVGITGTPKITNGGVGGTYYYNTSGNAFTGAGWAMPNSYNGGGRSIGGSYQNPYTYPMMVSITAVNGSSGAYDALVTLVGTSNPPVYGSGDTVVIAGPGGNGPNAVTVTFMVPPQKYYKVYNLNGYLNAVSAWVEYH